MASLLLCFYLVEEFFGHDIIPFLVAYIKNVPIGGSQLCGQYLRLYTKTNQRRPASIVLTGYHANQRYSGAIGSAKLQVIVFCLLTIHLQC